MTLHGVVKNFAGLLVVRLLLGVFEYVLSSCIRLRLPLISMATS